MKNIWLWISGIAIGVIAYLKIKLDSVKKQQAEDNLEVAKSYLDSKNKEERLTQEARKKGDDNAKKILDSDDDDYTLR